MKRWALIDPDGRVVQIIAGKPFPVHESLKWLDVSVRPEVEENMLRGRNGRFAVPPRRDIADSVPPSRKPFRKR